MKKEKYITKVIKNNNTYFQVTIKYNELGKRKCITKTFSVNQYGSESIALKAAIIERDNILNEIRANTFVARNDISFASVFEEMKNLFPQRERTVKKYNLHFNKYLEHLHHMQIQNITSYDVMKLLNAIAPNITKNTMVDVVTLLRKVFKTARIKRYITINIMDEVIVPEPQKRVKSTSKSTSYEVLSQVIELLNKKPGKSSKVQYKHKMIIGGLWTIYYCGLRPAEAFALEVEDIDFDKRLLSVNKQLGSDFVKNNVVRSTKTTLSNRILPIPNELVDILKEYCKDNKGFLFKDENGNHLKLSYIQDTIYHMCKKRGIDFTMYKLRHQFSTDLITNNTDVRTVMELMGHNNPSMTIEYARSNQKQKEEALKNRKYS